MAMIFEVGSGFFGFGDLGAAILRLREDNCCSFGASTDVFRSSTPPMRSSILVSASSSFTSSVSISSTPKSMTLPGSSTHWDMPTPTIIPSSRVRGTEEASRFETVFMISEGICPCLSDAGLCRCRYPMTRSIVWARSGLQVSTWFESPREVLYSRS